MKKDCLIKKKKWFGDGYNKYYNHNWAYKNKEERVCLNCKIKEIFFGLKYNGHYTEEDWRRKINS